MTTLIACVCGRFRPGSAYDDDQCRRCWKQHHDRQYAAHFVKPDRSSAVEQLLPAPRIPLVTCEHRGEELLGTQKAALGLNVNKSWAPCAKGHGTGGMACPCEGCGPACGDYWPEEGPRTVNVAGLHPDRHTTNCSIVRHQGKTLFAYRSGWKGSNIRLCELDARYAVVPGTDRLLHLSHPHAAGGQEDPRLFVFDGKLHVAFIGVRRTSADDPSAIPRQLFARLEDDGRVADVWEPFYPRSAAVEKNWQPFEFQGDLYAIYAMDPWTIVRLNGHEAEEFAVRIPGLTWRFGLCRGGAPPVRLGDKFYAFFHGTDTTGYYRDPVDPAVYSLGVVEFEAARPFAPLRMTREPLLYPPRHDLPPGPPGRREWYARTAYACGAYADVERERWVVSYGYQDHWCRVSEFSFDAVDAALSTV